MNEKNKIISLIEEKKQKYFDASDKIWEYAEIRFDTPKSAKVLCDLLEEESFKMKKGLANMENAFIATYGSGKPIVGILAEYDALTNLSQVPDIPERKFLIDNGNGHGCGHHVLGTGAVAAAIGIKDYLQENKIEGTIKLFGCPAEESGYGKAFMAREGIFSDLDVALAWHPWDSSGAWISSSLAVLQVYFNFVGIASHAAAMPEMGRSALDAAEIMNVGVNFLREHIIDEARIHYAFIDAGGKSANVVQPTASLHYFIRAPKTEQALDIYKRVVKIAEGAAHMTETQLEIVWDSAAANYIPNQTLTKAMYSNLKEITPIEYSTEEIEYGSKFFNTIDDSMKNSIRNRARTLFLEEEKIRELSNSPLISEILPYDAFKNMGGSTDVGDVSWNVPTGQIMVTCAPQGTPAHSWQWVATGKSSIMHKGMITAAKAIAMTAYDIIKKPNLLEEARKEHVVNLGGEKYKSAIPKNVVPK
ncbi:M20 family metallopeptidase [Miniphocaeibacter halophilus]|uniref:Amidohydrolase n=1 Tax=Miniphocaeibacter halophilus TaxID=2931922 RepID=A0AC61MMN2_9FIRM|nr:M20 family metallopeptidase [Miniphocaeibacter halophilus]QQK06910.1 amidohydrolase [Miniphocaeibacter halophilus]